MKIRTVQHNSGTPVDMNPLTAEYIVYVQCNRRRTEERRVQRNPLWRGGPRVSFYEPHMLPKPRHQCGLPCCMRSPQSTLANAKSPSATPRGVSPRTHKVIPLDDTTSARRRRLRTAGTSIWIHGFRAMGERPTARRDDLLRRAIDSWIAKRGSGSVSIAAQVGADDIHRETRDRISDLGQDDAPIFPAGSSTGDHKRN
jgi:hypothetical protein